VAARKKFASEHGRIYVGCSGWAYPGWKPGFYPAEVPTKKLLHYYATRLNSVEVNYTFRTLPSAATTAAWLAATGEDFRFTFKAPQRITHILRLKGCEDPLDRFRDAIAPVAEAGRAGMVFFQLPPNMRCDMEQSAGQSLDRLAEFLRAAARMEWRLSFEFRHASWFAEPVYTLLREHGAALCVAESDELTTPDVKTAAFACYRLRKSEYSAQDLTAIRETLQQCATEGDVFAYFKHEEEPTGALRASQVSDRLHSA
jgi:uncharacterized protein YecE (DUF72 family)